MPERYFHKFPKTSYANTNCVDITKRITLDSVLSKSTSLYQKYTIKTNARADIIAQNYYDDGYLDWLIYLNNQIIDPYHDWVMSEYDFEKFLITKYGSIENSQRKIAYYQLNWNKTDEEISADFYENSLPEYFRKYYTPIYSSDDKVISFKRRQDNVITNTNMIKQFDMTFTSGNNFTEGEVINILSPSGANVVGKCEVIMSNSSVTFCKNISGNSSSGSLLSALDKTRIAQTTLAFATHTNLTDDEFVYWEEVSFYTYEFEKNEDKRNIKLVNTGYSSEIAEDFRKLMKKK